MSVRDDVLANFVLTAINNFHGHITPIGVPPNPHRYTLPDETSGREYRPLRYLFTIVRDPVTQQFGWPFQWTEQTSSRYIAVAHCYMDVKADVYCAKSGQGQWFDFNREDIE